jgi:sulfatase maturation enzyme AslB (radical SAM superfamily)
MKFLKEAIDREEVDDILNTLFITLMITKNCNFKCDYCDVVDFEEKHRFITFDEFEAVLNFIDYQKPRPNLVFRFFGGEPTIHPQFIEMCHAVKERFEGRMNVDITVTTNLSKPYRYIESIPKFVTVAASLHTDWISNYDDWFSKVIRLNTKGMLHHVLLMLKEDNHDIIKDLYTRYNPILPVVIAPIDQYLVTPEYKKFKEEFPCEVDDSEYEAFFGTRDSKTLMCSSGLFIDEDGGLFTCWSKFEKKHNVFENPRYRHPQFHLCRQYGEHCDKEVPRCSLTYYMENFSNKEDKTFTKEELEEYNNKKILFRCNG